MRIATFLLIVMLACSCNNDKIDRLESEIRDIKKSLARIETMLSGAAPETNTTIAPQDAYSNTYKPTKTKSKGQCNAITKKGTQCSRSSRSGGYCWQHGG